MISALATIELCYNASRNRSCDLMTSLKVSGKSKYFSECNSVTCLNIVISDQSLLSNLVGNNVRLETELIIYLLITEINVSVLHIRSRDRKFINGSDSEGNLIPMTTNKQTAMF